MERAEQEDVAEQEDRTVLKDEPVLENKYVNDDKGVTAAPRCKRVHVPEVSGSQLHSAIVRRLNALTRECMHSHEILELLTSTGYIRLAPQSWLMENMVGESLEAALKETQYSDKNPIQRQRQPRNASVTNVTSSAT